MAVKKERKVELSKAIEKINIHNFMNFIFDLLLNKVLKSDM